jgi:hypothetical protein
MEHQDALSVSVTDTAGKAILNIRLPAGALSEVATPAAPDRDLTECERDILAVIEEKGKRIKESVILPAFRAAGKRHGDSTV